MKRLLFVILAIAAEGSLALAAPPVPNDQIFTLSADDPRNDCGFDVKITSAGKMKTITLPGDRLSFTSPGLDATITNLSDLTKTVTLNVTGAQHVSKTQTGDDLTVFTGRNLVATQDTGLVLVIGNFSFVLHGEELVQPLMGHGQLIHVCPLIS